MAQVAGSTPGVGVDQRAANQQQRIQQGVNSGAQGLKKEDPLAELLGSAVLSGPFSLHRSGSLPLSQRFSDAGPLPRGFYQPHHRPPFVVGQVDLALDVIPQQRKNA